MVIPHPIHFDRKEAEHIFTFVKGNVKKKKLLKIYEILNLNLLPFEIERHLNRVVCMCLEIIFGSSEPRQMVGK